MARTRGETDCQRSVLPFLPISTSCKVSALRMGIDHEGPYNTMRNVRAAICPMRRPRMPSESGALPSGQDYEGHRVALLRRQSRSLRADIFLGYEGRHVALFRRQRRSLRGDIFLTAEARRSAQDALLVMELSERREGRVWIFWASCS